MKLNDPLMVEAYRQTWPEMKRYTILLGGPRDTRFVKEMRRQGSGVRVTTAPVDDREELLGTGTLISLAGGKVKGVLTAGHVVEGVWRQQAAAQVEGGPYVRISGTAELRPLDELTEEHSLILARPWTKTWGESADATQEGWKPDLGFVSIPEPMGAQLAERSGGRFYPWDGRRKRVELRERPPFEQYRIGVGMLGERQRKGNGSTRVLLAYGVRPDKSAGGLTEEGHDVWEYEVTGSNGEELVELRANGKNGELVKQRTEEIRTYQGMSGGGMWSIYFQPERPARSMTCELHGVLLAETPRGGEGSKATRLLAHGTGVVERFLAETAEERRQQIEEAMVGPR